MLPYSCKLVRTLASYNRVKIIFPYDLLCTSRLHRFGYYLFVRDGITAISVITLPRHTCRPRQPASLQISSALNTGFNNPGILNPGMRRLQRVAVDCIQ